MTTRLLRSEYVAGAAGERERTQLDARLRSDGRAPPDTPAALAGAARLAGARRFRFDARRGCGARRRARAACSRRLGRGVRCLPRGLGMAARGHRLAPTGRRRRVSASCCASSAPCRRSRRTSRPEQALAELQELAAAPFQPEGGEPAVFVMEGWEDRGSDSTACGWRASPRRPGRGRSASTHSCRSKRRGGSPCRARAPRRCVAEAEAVVAAWQAQAGALVLSSPLREDDTDVDASPLLPAGCDTPATRVVQYPRSVAVRQHRARNPGGRRAAGPRRGAGAGRGTPARTAVALSVPRFRRAAAARVATRGAAGGIRPAPARAGSAPSAGAVLVRARLAGGVARARDVSLPAPRGRRRRSRARRHRARDGRSAHPRTRARLAARRGRWPAGTRPGSRAVRRRRDRARDDRAHRWAGVAPACRSGGRRGRRPRRDRLQDGTRAWHVLARRAHGRAAAPVVRGPPPGSARRDRVRGGGASRAPVSRA